jgi:hypothetical protein
MVAVYLLASLAFSMGLLVFGGMWVDARIKRILYGRGDGFIPAYLLLMGSFLVYLIVCAFTFDFLARLTGVHHG